LPIKLVTHPVKREKLRPQVLERGTLEAAANAEAVCRVRAQAKGGRVATTIKRLLVEDGDKVKKGQLLIELDSSGLQDQLRTQNITRDAAKNAWEQAEGNLVITKTQNEADVEAAKTALMLAEIDLNKYVNGDYPAALKAIDNELARRQDRVDNNKRMAKKNNVTPRQAQADQIALDKSKDDKKVLEFTRKRMVTQYTRAVEEAKRNLDRIKKQAETKEALAVTDLKAKKSIYEQERDRAKQIQEEIDKCMICAPRDGMVVYVVPEQARWGGGPQQSIVAQGEPVREGQKLMYIPDLAKMQVVIRVPEALVAHVRPDMPAVVRVDAFPTVVLRGRVSQVAARPTERDWLTADEKVYPTRITIDTKFDGLRPGLSASVTLDPGLPAENVLTVPARAILGPAGFGKMASCLVLAPGGPEEREVVLGLGNEKGTVITSGLREGDEVIVNPRLLLNEIRDRIRLLRGGNRPQPRRGN
jgi:multidrug efflux pump subunit AcrA (membrane-fusion protein)